VPDYATLQRWTEQGHVRSDDYLVNHPLDVCVQARDVAELDAILRRARAQVLGRIWRALACAGLVLVWVQPLFGSLLLMSAMGAAVLALWTLRHRATYRLSTAAPDSRDGQPGTHTRILTVRAA